MGDYNYADKLTSLQCVTFYGFVISQVGHCNVLAVDFEAGQILYDKPWEAMFQPQILFYEQVGAGFKPARSNKK